MGRRSFNGMLATLVLSLLGAFVAVAGEEPREIDAVAMQKILADQPVCVFVFLSIECPISNQYIPEINRLATRFGTNAQVIAVYPNADETTAQIVQHRADYKITIPEWRDSKHVLARFCGAHLTPEAVVVKGGKILYRGRIDDRYVDLGKSRIEAHEHDLENAIRSVLSGAAKQLVSKSAVGCAISNLTEQ